MTEIPIEDLFPIFDKMRAEAERLERTNVARTLKGAYTVMLGEAVGAYLAGEGKLIDNRTRKWAVSFSLSHARGGFSKHNPGIVNYTTPAFREDSDGTVDMGQWASCIGLGGVQEHIETIARAHKMPEELLGLSLSKALKGMRGPISRGQGFAKMRYARFASMRIKGVQLGTWRDVDVEWFISAAIMREELAPRKTDLGPRFSNKTS